MMFFVVPRMGIKVQTGVSKCASILNFWRT